MKKQYDPRMHSAEHILNQTMVRLLHTDRSFSAHIEKKKSKCDYRFDRKLTDEEIGEFRIISTSFTDEILRIRYKLSQPE